MNNRNMNHVGVKSRPVLVLIGVVVMAGGLIAYNLSDDDKASAVTANENAVANVANIANDAQTLPGVGNPSQDFTALQKQANELKAKDAKDQGISAVPTLTKEDVTFDPQTIAARREAENRARQEQEAAFNRLLEQRRLEEAARVQAQSGIETSAAATAVSEAYKNRIANQSRQLLAGWAQVPGQQYLQGSGEPLSNAVLSGAINQSDTASTNTQSRVIYKAGDIAYAVMETAINSDEPGPILAKIVNGPLQGAKMIGSYTPAGDGGQKLSLTFNVLNVPNLSSTFAMNAVAIDPNTARTAIASHVDNHYLLRYGSFLGATFLQGVSQAVLAGLNNTGVTFEGTTINAKSLKSTGDERLLAGLGNIGVQVAEKTNLLNKKPTITIAAGTSFGLLFLENLDINQSSAGDSDAG